MKKTLVIAGMLFVSLLPTTAFARQHNAFQIGGHVYEFIVDEIGEPVAVGDKSGIEVQVNDLGTGTDGRIDNLDKNGKPVKSEAVAGLEQTLSVEVSADGQKKIFHMLPAWNAPGQYGAPFNPSVAGSYIYRFFGSIASVPVDLTFTCADSSAPAAAPDTKPVKISDQVTRVEQSGVIPCPTERSQAEFPTVTHAAQSESDLAKKQSRILVLAIAALSLSVVSLALHTRPRKK